MEIESKIDPPTLVDLMGEIRELKSRLLENLVPLDVLLWTVDDLMAYFKCSRVTAYAIIKSPGFPRRIDAPGDPRYIAGQVIKFAEKRK